jgi:hypothetical protein
METAATTSPTHPPLQVPLNRMETEGNNARDVTARIPQVLFNDNECRYTVEVERTDDETFAPEELLPSFRDGAAAAVLDAEVVEEQDLQQELEEPMDNMTVDAVLVVNMSSNEEESNKARADLQRKSTTIKLLVAAALIILTIASGTAIGTKSLWHKPLATIVTVSPTTSISVLEFARNILSPLSGDEALMDKPCHSTRHFVG